MPRGRRLPPSSRPLRGIPEESRTGHSHTESRLRPAIRVQTSARASRSAARYQQDAAGEDRRVLPARKMEDGETGPNQRASSVRVGVTLVRMIMAVSMLVAVGMAVRMIVIMPMLVAVRMRVPDVRRVRVDQIAARLRDFLFQPRQHAVEPHFVAQVREQETAARRAFSSNRAPSLRATRPHTAPDRFC